VLEEKQTHPDGRVWYGRAITYAKIAGWFGLDRPSERTVRRWAAELRKTRTIVVKHVRMNQGIRIAIAAPRKHFRIGSGTAEKQMSLFSEPVQIPVQKPAEKLRNSQSDVRPPVAAPCGHWWPEKDVKTLKEHLKKKALAPARAAPHPADDREPWNEPKRARMLDEFYSLKRTLARIPLRHPRFDELSAKMRRIEDELGNHAVEFADTG
jgi:hypothetical protein